MMETFVFNGDDSEPIARLCASFLLRGLTDCQF